MKTTPKPEIKVRISPRKMVEITRATIISVSRTMVEVTGERCFNPFNQRKYGITQQKIAV